MGRGEREGYGGPYDVTSLSLSRKLPGFLPQEAAHGGVVRHECRFAVDVEHYRMDCASTRDRR